MVLLHMLLTHYKVLMNIMCSILVIYYMRDNLMTGRNTFYMSFIFSLELKDHLLDLNIDINCSEESGNTVPS